MWLKLRVKSIHYFGVNNTSDMISETPPRCCVNDLRQTALTERLHCRRLVFLKQYTTHTHTHTIARLPKLGHDPVLNYHFVMQLPPSLRRGDVGFLFHHHLFSPCDLSGASRQRLRDLASRLDIATRPRTKPTEGGKEKGKKKKSQLKNGSQRKVRNKTGKWDVH